MPSRPGREKISNLTRGRLPRSFLAIRAVPYYPPEGVLIQSLEYRVNGNHRSSLTHA